MAALCGGSGGGPLVQLCVVNYSSWATTLFFFYKNKVYTNVEPQIQ